MWPDSLRLCDATLASPTENLDFDLALVRAVQADPAAATLRVWEAAQHAVIVGRSNDIEQEVDVAACQADGVPIVRRPSGGGAVVIGPGCLCFSLALPIPGHHAELGISGITRAVMQHLAASLAVPHEDVQVQGISDLVLRNRKFSGNSQRWLRTAFLHHGTILYEFDLERLERYLNQPSRQPEYRQGRPHREFVTNLTRPRESLIRSLAGTWNAIGS